MLRNKFPQVLTEISLDMSFLKESISQNSIGEKPSTALSLPSARQWRLLVPFFYGIGIMTYHGIEPATFMVQVIPLPLSSWGGQNIKVAWAEFFILKLLHYIIQVFQLYCSIIYSQSLIRTLHSYDVFTNHLVLKLPLIWFSLIHNNFVQP